MTERLANTRAPENGTVENPFSDDAPQALRPTRTGQQLCRTGMWTGFGCSGPGGVLS